MSRIPYHVPTTTRAVGFYREQHELVCDGVPLAAIAAAEGTPLYVYSAETLRARYRAIDAAFDGYPHTIHYALKANSTLAVARLLRELGSAVDANTVWEVEVARKAGFQPSQIVFTGVGKSPAEIECAVGLGVKAINVESAGFGPVADATVCSNMASASRIVMFNSPGRFARTRGICSRCRC